MSHCPECRRRLSEQSNFCPNCGAKKVEYTERSFSILRPTNAWYLFAFLFNIFGGIIGYFAVKDQDPKMANNLLIVGFISICLFVGSFVFPGPFWGSWL